MCPLRRAKSNKYVTSDTKEITFAVQVLLVETAKKLALINLYYLCSCVHPK